MNALKLFTYTFEKNVGRTDSVLRVITGAAIAGAGVLLPIPGPWNYVLLAVGAAWAVTGLLSRCSIYYLFGLSTRKTP